MTEYPDPQDNWAYYDPFLSKVRHPQLPTGVNSTPINGNEANGPGYNEPIWPMIFDSFEGFAPIFLSADHMDTFNECPDVVIPCVNNTVVFPQETRTSCVGEDA